MVASSLINLEFLISFSSKFTSPISFTITATFGAFCAPPAPADRKICFNNVVFPDPRKPESTVTGNSRRPKSPPTKCRTRCHHPTRPGKTSPPVARRWHLDPRRGRGLVVKAKLAKVNAAKTRVLQVVLTEGGGWPGCITCGLEDVASKCLDATNPGLRAIFLTNSMSWLCFKEFHWFYCDCILVCACLCIGSLGKQQLIWRHFLVSVYGILSEETTSSKGYDMMPLISFELCWQLYSSIKEFFAPVIQGCKA